MSFILLFLAGVPLPSVQQHLMLHKQEKLLQYPELLGDYWNPGHDYDVLHYFIDMTVDIPADSVWADVTITLEALSDTMTSIPLNFHWAYKIESIKEDDRDLAWSNVFIDTFSVFLDREVTVGETLSITVSYHGSPAEQDGLFIAEDESEDAVTFTDAEPQGARHWIPCYDEPSDKATFTQCITVPAGNDLVANGTLSSLEQNGQWWTYTWEEHYPQPTYLIAFAASKNFVTADTFAMVDGTQLPMRTWVLEVNDVRYRFDCTPGIVVYYSDIFPPYPYLDEKYDQLHAPIGGAMENTTCTFFNTYANWGEDWSWVIAHELSHHWWGDWLTCATWADLWLNEGFATYCEVLWWEEKYGQEGHDAYARRIMDIYLDHGQRHPIYDPPWSDLFGITTYKKGGSVLHMMRQVLGDSIFFAGINEYGWQHANEAVITDDFQNVMEDVAGQDLDWFFDQWIYGPGHPHYEIGWNLGKALSAPYTVEFAIAQTQSKSKHYYPFRMPLEIAVYSGGNEEIFTIIDSVGYQRFSVEVSAEPDSFRLDPCDKVLCEITQHDDIDDVPDPGVSEDPTTQLVTLSADDVFTDLLNVDFSQPGADLVRLVLYDAAGRQVREFYQGFSSRYHRVYPVGELPAGVYFVRLEYGNDSAIVQKAIKVR